MQEKLTENIKNIVAEQVHDGFKKNLSIMEDSVLNAVRSRAVTPSPHDTHVRDHFKTVFLNRVHKH